MYLSIIKGIGETPGPINTLRMRMDECPPSYKPGEVTISRTSGFLHPSVTRLEGRLLIADFGVGQVDLKPAAKKEILLKESLSIFEREKDLHFRIVGFSDCVGAEKSNLKLRNDRAMTVFRLFSRSAQSRVVSVGAAQSGVYIPGTNNTTAEGRARNRSVMVEFWRDSGARNLTELPKSVKERIEKEAEGSMEIERRRRQAERKRWEPVPKSRDKSAKEKIRDRLRAEGVPEWGIDQLFKTAMSLGRVAAKSVLNGMNISDAAKEFVKDRLQDITSGDF